jgi:hypothetical protein
MSSPTLPDYKIAFQPVQYLINTAAAVGKVIRGRRIERQAHTMLMKVKREKVLRI